MPELWWKDAIIYGIDVERFHDGNGDGIGDFQGLISKLDYIADLGVTCVWLLPFYPSNNRDNGYDITDYFRVHTRYGTFEDFLAFVRRAGELGLRVILDLVVHHTSDHHPWFQAARHDPKSPYRDFYYWTDHPPPARPGKGPMFPGEEKSVWTYDELAGAYYHHRFYRFQPGLNHSNPKVLAQIEEVVDYWLSFGVSGFRVDAASHMVERPIGPEPVDKSHAVLRHLYHHTVTRKPDVLLMGEVDETPERLKDYFDGEQLNMMFNFLLNNYLILALASEKAEPVRRAIDMLPPVPLSGQWANFLRNLDEADLERLAPEEMEVVNKAFAPKPEMRIFGRGIRRRLAPMLQGNKQRLKMAYSLLFSLPGSPVIVYGDEIGMGEDLSQHGRNSVRTPMQWSAAKNGGFSSAPNNRIIQPAVEDGPFSYKSVNVELQQSRPDSLLNFIKQLAAARLAHKEIGTGFVEFLESSSEQVLVHRYPPGETALVIMHNLSGKEAPVDIKLGISAQPRHEPILGGDIPDPVEGRLHLKLEPYGFRWIRVHR
ncbi:alpha-amylase family protein [Rhodoligotrophos defluvii]|uniref:alpha-amylase family protein n=1 Tax=Rhodoligotrophos defluvii TaxID=2561934 RepID=UPI0010CA1DD6|nr:alpha-amylase family protein [Rhodoligotrophos defluvii]